jgi:hypothetical protein
MKVTVAYHRAAGVVRWLVDAAEVARVGNVGFPAAGRDDDHRSRRPVLEAPGCGS